MEEDNYWLTEEEVAALREEFRTTPEKEAYMEKIWKKKFEKQS